jgi:hypothetical protein
VAASILIKSSLAAEQVHQPWRLQPIAAGVTCLHGIARAAFCKFQDYVA